MTNFSVKIFNKKYILSAFVLIIIIAISLFTSNYGKINIADGTIISTHENVFSKIDGNICEIPIKEGDIVQKGDLLVKIFPAKYEIRLKKIESSKIQATKEYSEFEKTFQKRTNELDIAKKDCDRNQSMFDENITTKQDFDRSVNELQNANLSYLAAKKDKEDAENKLNILKAQVEQAKIDLKNTKIIATENGKITSIFVKNNENIYKDRLVLSINANRLVIVVPKKQTKFSKIKPEQPVVIKLKNSQTKINGKIEQVLNNEDFKNNANLVITDNCTILSVKTDEDFSNAIDGFQNIKMTIKIK